MRLNTRLIIAFACVAGAAMTSIAAAQHGGHGAASSPPPATKAKPSAPVSMEELHRQGGVPRGWKFALPAGDPKAGREVFNKLECYRCHEVKPDFPRGERSSGDVGPELTGMGSHHPAEYFAQSVVDPNAVILAGPGFVGADGRSVMPDYGDTLTFTELVDLVAYLKSLDAGGRAGHQAGSPVRERTVGPYRVRVTYDAQGQHAHHARPTGAQGHLMAFVTDASTGEPVPYLPVTAVIAAGKGAARTVRLTPMVSDDGFHYGADLTIPEDTRKVTLHVGAAVVKTTGAAAERFRKPVTLSFDWSE